MMVKDEWIVHPNRSELGPDKPGRNGHSRTMQRPRSAVTMSKCLARVELPASLSGFGDADGAVTFGGLDWWFVVGAARSFARSHLDGEVLPPFGYTHRGAWWWWDDTTTEESILDAPDAETYVQEYLNRLFQGMSITLTDAR